MLLIFVQLQISLLYKYDEVLLSGQFLLQIFVSDHVLQIVVQGICVTFCLEQLILSVFFSGLTT